MCDLCMLRQQTPEGRDHLSEKLRAYHKNLSQEKKTVRAKKVSEALKRYWDKHGPRPISEETREKMRRSQQARRARRLGGKLVERQGEDIELDLDF